MLVEAIVLSLLIGLLKGGKIRRFRSLKKKTFLILFLGIFIQGIIVFLNNLVGVSSIEKVLTYNRELLILSFGLILVGIVTNYRFRSLWLCLIGYVMNFLMIFSNGFKRPVLLEALSLTGREPLVEPIRSASRGLYVPLTEATKYPMLTNTIVFSKPYPLPKIISMGDLIVAFGIFLFIQDLMFRRDSFMSR